MQGLNRQIRRMCDYFDYEAVKLERVRIMNINLKGLPAGEWRDLNEQELGSLFQLIKHSSSEADTSTKTAKKKPHKTGRKKPPIRAKNQPRRPGRSKRGRGK